MNNKNTPLIGNPLDIVEVSSTPKKLTKKILLKITNIIIHIVFLKVLHCIINNSLYFSATLNSFQCYPKEHKWLIFSVMHKYHYRFTVVECQKCMNTS
jgi:hypothetical protein